jgi:hypothetical protein
MSKLRKAAIYARASTTDQDPDAQLLALCEDIYRIVAIILPRHNRNFLDALEICRGGSVYYSPLRTAPHVNSIRNDPSLETVAAPGRGCRPPPRISGLPTVRPLRHAFGPKIFHFYATMLHEMVHWTGHPSRLHRHLSRRYSDDSYAFEELIAEIGSAFLCAHFSIPLTELRHTEYLAGWLKILKGDKTAIFKAASLAQQASEYIIARSPALGLEASDVRELQGTVKRR